MDLNRIAQIIRSRWLWLAAFAVLGVAAAVVGVSMRNNAIEPQLLVDAPLVIVDSPELDKNGRVSAAVATQIEEAYQGALDVDADILADNPSAHITAVPEEGRVVFSARGQTVEEARSLAEDMRSRYLTESPYDPVRDIDEQIESVTSRLAALRTQLLDIDLAGAAAVIDPDADRRADLQALLASLKLRLVDLEEERLVGSEREPQEVLDEIDRVEAAAGIAEERLNQLPPVPEPESLFTEEATQKRVLESLFTQLETRYEGLLIQRGDASNPTIVEDSILTDETPVAASVPTSGALGLLAGLVLGVTAILGSERFNRVVWSPSDVETVAALASVPTRRTTSGTTPWYDSTAGDERKVAIQALRSSIEGRLRGEQAVLGVVGFRTSPPDRHALAADLAVGMASAGRTVLLVDADMENPSELPEFSTKEASLADILSGSSFDVERTRSAVADAFERSTPSRPGLTAIRAGRHQGDPADLLAGPNFRVLLAEARERYDLVVIVGGEVEDPTASAVLQRLDHAIVAVSPGQVSVARFEASIGDIRDRNVDVLGAVLLARGLRAGHADQRELTHTPDVATERPGRPLVEVGRSRGETERSPSMALSGDFDDEPPDLSVLDEPMDNAEVVISDIVTELRVADPRATYRAVAEYLVGWVEKLMAATSRDRGSYEPETLAGVRANAFVPLRAVKGHRSVGEVLEAELRARAGRAASKLDRELRRVLAVGVGRKRMSVDEWLDDHFFAAHIDRSEREPTVWHLASPGRAISVLVHAPRLDRERLERLGQGYVRDVVGALERELKTAVRQGRPDEAEALEAQLRDAHLFEISLGWLYEGSQPNARIVYPWKGTGDQPSGWAPDWSEGVRPNIAPMQRLGLLPVPVLTDEELVSLEPKA